MENTAFIKTLASAKFRLGSIPGDGDDADFLGTAVKEDLGGGGEG